jgi:hypothetical protein
MGQNQVSQQGNMRQNQGSQQQVKGKSAVGSNANINAASSNSNTTGVGEQWQKIKTPNKTLAIIITVIYVVFLVFALEEPIIFLLGLPLSVPISIISGNLTSVVYTNGQFKATLKNRTLIISGSGELPNCNNSSAFPWYSNVTSIKKIVVENGVTAIGDNFFYGLSMAKNVFVAGTVTKIGDNAFGGCTSIRKINIPALVTNIGKNAFFGCAALTEAIFGNPNGWAVSENKDASQELYVPLAGVTTNANYLKNIYCSFYWYKK